MKLISLLCNQCGAPLEVLEGTRFATCRFCSTQLAIEQTESAYFSRVLEALGRQTTEFSKDLAAVKLQQELDRLDQQWATAQGSTEQQPEHSQFSAVMGAVALS